MNRAIESDSSKGMNPSLAVVIPMFNEEQGAERCIRAVCAAVAALPTRTVLIVVNDGSTDGTREALAKLRRGETSFVTLEHDRNRGYGEALRTGACYASSAGYDYVLFMDSDLTNDPACLPAFLEKMTQGYDVIKASRYTSGGGSVGVPAWRVVISRLGNRIARGLYGIPIRDCTNGFRAIRSRLFVGMPLTEDRFPLIMEELYHAKKSGCSFTEVPVVLRNRTKDQRPTSFAYRPQTFYRYMKYAVLAWLKA